MQAAATPLHEVTFVTIDLETTGGSPTDAAITEIGATKHRGGECLGTFQTLVNPGTAIPRFITVLTGITESMVLPAPPLDAVLPSLLEFVGDAVIVAHNLRFDRSFLDAALTRRGDDPLTNLSVDTLALARRLVRDELPNLKLATLAHGLRTASAPSHRALDDARATAEVLHRLLERAAGFGVLGLDDLLALPRLREHSTVTKLRLTARVPRSPGVYLFRDRRDRVLYVGTARNLRTTVRAHFSAETGRRAPPLLLELSTIEHLTCEHERDARRHAARLIARHAPRFNRARRPASRARRAGRVASQTPWS